MELKVGDIDRPFDRACAGNCAEIYQKARRKNLDRRTKAR